MLASWGARAPARGACRPRAGAARRGRSRTPASGSVARRGALSRSGPSGEPPAWGRGPGRGTPRRGTPAAIAARHPRPAGRDQAARPRWWTARPADGAARGPRRPRSRRGSGTRPGGGLTNRWITVLPCSCAGRPQVAAAELVRRARQVPDAAVGAVVGPVEVVKRGRGHAASRCIRSGAARRGSWRVRADRFSLVPTNVPPPARVQTAAVHPVPSAQQKRPWSSPLRRRGRGGRAELVGVVVHPARKAQGRTVEQGLDGCR